MILLEEMSREQRSFKSRRITTSSRKGLQETTFFLAGGYARSFHFISFTSLPFLFVFVRVI